MSRSSQIAKAAASGRLTYFDGLRGVAALAVVIDHIANFVPGFVYDGTAPHVGADLWQSVLHFPVRAGPYSVYIFFVLSGFVIAKSAARGNDPLIQRVVRRYVRLTAPMLASTVTAWALLQCFPGTTATAGRLLNAPWISSIYPEAVPPFAHAVAEALWGTYSIGNSYFDPVLWSMRVELAGSVSLYFMYALTPQRYRLAVAIASITALLAAAKAVYLGFPFGALLFELWLRNRLKPSLVAGTAAMVVGLLIGPLGQSQLFLPALAWFKLHMGGQWAPQGPLYSVGALLVVWGVAVTPWANGALRRSGAQFLGRISYGLYLIHLPLLMTGFTALYIAITPGGSYPVLAGWSTLYLAAAILAAWLLTRLVDEPVVRALKLIRLPFRLPRIRLERLTQRRPTGESAAAIRPNP